MKTTIQFVNNETQLHGEWITEEDSPIDHIVARRMHEHYKLTFDMNIEEFSYQTLDSARLSRERLITLAGTINRDELVGNVIEGDIGRLEFEFNGISYVHDRVIVRSVRYESKVKFPGDLSGEAPIRHSCVLMFEER